MPSSFAAAFPITTPSVGLVMSRGCDGGGPYDMPDTSVKNNNITVEGRVGAI